MTVSLLWYISVSPIYISAQLRRFVYVFSYILIMYHVIAFKLYNNNTHKY